MKKVYLVLMKGTTVNNNYRETVWAVFSNKHKAETYTRYKTLITDKEWLKIVQMTKVRWEIQTERIWTEDFTSKLEIIKKEKLPF